MSVIDVELIMPTATGPKDVSISCAVTQAVTVVVRTRKTGKKPEGKSGSATRKVQDERR